MTGWRLGWMVVPKDMLRAVECLAQNLFISPPALSQHAGIAENAGFEGYVVVAKVRESGQGFNAATGEYGDLMAAGVIDPVKVTRSAVHNAASIASMLLTTETLVAEKPEEEVAAPGAGHGHGHGH